MFITVTHRSLRHGECDAWDVMHGQCDVWGINMIHTSTCNLFILGDPIMMYEQCDK